MSPVFKFTIRLWEAEGEDRPYRIDICDRESGELLMRHGYATDAERLDARARVMEQAKS